NLQSDQRARPLPLDRFLSLHAAAGRALREVFSSGVATPDEEDARQLRRLHRRLPVSLRDRKAVLGISMYRAERLGGVQRDRAQISDDVGRLEGGAGRRGGEA